VIDLIRRTYTTHMRLYRDSDELTPVRWYWCQPGARPLPFATCFNSNVHMLNDPWAYYGGPGETEEFPVFAPGDPPHPLPGLHHCGTADQWLGGLTHPLVPGPTWPDGTPLCCGTRPITPGLGLGLGLSMRMRVRYWWGPRFGLTAGLTGADHSPAHLAASLPLRGGLASVEAAVGQLAAHLGLRAGLALTDQAVASLAASLGLVLGLAEAYHPSAHQPVALGLKAGLASAEHAAAQLAAHLGLLSGVSMADHAAAVLPAHLALAIGQSTAEQASAILPILLQLHAGLVTTDQATAKIAAILGLTTGLASAEKGQAKLAEALGLKAGLTSVEKAPAVDAPAPMAKLTVSMTFVASGPAHTGPVYQTSSSASQAGGTSIAPALPGGTVATDLVIACICQGVSPAPTLGAPAGWTPVHAQIDQATGPASISMRTWWALGNVASTTFTSTSAVGGMRAELIRISNQHATPLDVTGAVQSNAGSATIVLPGVTTVHDNSLRVCSFAELGLSVTLPTAPGFTAHSVGATIPVASLLTANALTTPAGATGSVTITAGAGANQVLEGCHFAIRSA
jgi:hypothetical protein